MVSRGLYTDGDDWHVALVYRTPNYNTVQDIVDMNLTTAQAIALQGTGGRSSPMAYVGGRVYVPSGDPGWLMSYDPVTGEAVTHGQSGDPAYSIELRDNHYYQIAVAPDGRLAMGTYSKGGVQIYDPATGVITPYGSADPADTAPRYGHTLAWDAAGTHVYVCVRPNAVDAVPMYYYLAVLDVATGQYTLHFKADFDTEGTAFQGTDGNAYYYRKTQTPQILWYALSDGELTLLETAPEVHPSYNRTGTMNKEAAYWETESGIAVDLSEEYVTNDHMPVIRWGESSEASVADYEFNLSAYNLWRMVAWGDKLLCQTNFYGPLIVYDPVTKTVEASYRKTPGTYQPVLMTDGQIALAGYPSAVLLWDTTQPWTASDIKTDETTNPRTIAGVAKYHRFAVYHAGVNQLYVFGEEERSDEGTTLVHYNAAGEQQGTLKDTTWGAHGLVSLPGAIVASEPNEQQLVVITPGTMDVERTITPWLDAPPGAIVGVSDTDVVCIYATRACRVNTATGATVWSVALPAAAWSGWTYWYDRLPEYAGGFVWFPCGGELYKLAIANGAVTLAAEENLNARRFGADLYLYGGPDVKRIVGLFT